MLPPQLYKACIDYWALNPMLINWFTWPANHCCAEDCSLNWFVKLG